MSHTSPSIPNPPLSPSPNTETPTSYKKPLRIRSQQSEKRRNALKEYYKLKEQQESLEASTSVAPGNTPLPDALGDDEDDLEKEITEDRPISEIDLSKAEFKDVLKQTNRLSTFINLINSNIKNIIYNNYYELIKLNDFLKDLNELSLDKVTKAEDEKKDVLDFLNMKKNDIDDNTPVTLDTQGLDKLRQLMHKIEVMDQNEYTKVATKNDTSVTSGISTLIQLRDDNLTLKESYKDQLKEKLTIWIDQLKKNDGQQGLIRQLEDVKRSLQS